MDEIIENGRVRRGELGFGGEAFPQGQGIVVQSVDINGPAYQAGLKINDVILAVDGLEVTDGRAILTLIASTEPGTKMELIVQRNDELVRLTAIVGELVSTS